MDLEEKKILDQYSQRFIGCLSDAQKDLYFSMLTAEEEAIEQYNNKKIKIMSLLEAWKRNPASFKKAGLHKL